MTFHRLSVSVCLTLSLGAGIWCAAAASRPTVPQAADVGRAAASKAAAGNPWDAIEWVERRYKIEAIRFKCRDETGADWLGSDEVMISTRDAKGWTVSNEIGHIDSGDTHNFDPAKSCIISVRPGRVVLGESSVSDGIGEPAPLWFEVEFWEKDVFGFPFGFCAVLDPAPGDHGPTHCADDGAGDDFIGRARLEFAAWELEAALPNVGDEHIETVKLFPCGSDSTVCDTTWSADYTFTYRITRLRDQRVDLRSLLRDAMRRSGARSEVEAIASGLRFLRAPIPRKIEPAPAK